MGSTRTYDRTEMKLNVTDYLYDQDVIKKRSVVVSGHRTSVSLETIFWDKLRSLASQRHKSVNQLITEIDQHCKGSLSSALRVFVLKNIHKL
jgi:predicted DNA-binding ribbon-helix-helix protein